MTKVDAWKCDICNNIFIEKKNDPEYLNPSDIVLTMNAPCMSTNTMEHHFHQTCLKCRKIIESFIFAALRECRIEEKTII